MGRYIELPQINDKATKKSVEMALYQYRDFMITLPMDMMPKVTPSYSLVPPSNTNGFHSSTEDVAIERMEYEEKRNAFMNEIHVAVNTLKEKERAIIIKKYMEDGIGYDPDIYSEIGVGKTKYYILKGEAMLRLAFALKIEVYKGKKEA